MATDKPTTQIPDDYIPTWDEIGHLLERGQVADVVYDTETVDTNRNFNAVLDLGAATADLAGRVVDTLEVDARVPDHRTIAPQAALVNKRGPKDWDNGVSQHILAGKFADALRNAPRKVYDKLTDEEEITPITRGKARKEETVRKMYFRDENGDVKHARLHEKGKYVSIPVTTGKADYEDEDGQKWRKMRSAIQVTHFYGIRADDPWMWGAFDMAGMPDIFLTHTKKNDARRSGAYRNDVHKLAQMVRLYGPQGEQGMKTLESKWGGESFRLQDLMAANTNHAVPERGIEVGARMPDGSEYNEKKGHKRALLDALATLGFKTFLRRIAPDVVKHAEVMADFDSAKDFVHGADGFEDNPVLGIGRVMRGRATGHMGMLVNIDEEQGDFKNALFIRLDVDLPNYRYGGKRVMEMSEKELTTMMKEQKFSADALFQTEHLRKNPNVVRAEMAFEAGQNQGYDPEVLEENRHYMLENPVFLERVMTAWDKAQPRFKRAHDLPNALPEEEIFTGVGDLPYYTVKDRHGEPQLLPRALHQRAEDARNHGRNVDRMLKHAIEPDALEWDPDREDGLADFKAKMKKAKEGLERYGWHDAKILRQFEVAANVKTAEQAVNQIWKMRKSLMGKFHDYSMSYEVQDARGNQVPFEKLIEMHPQELHMRLDAGNLEVKFEQLRSAPTTRKIARMFWDEGKIDDLGPAWKEYMQSEIAHYQQGMPNLDPEDQRLMTIPRALKEIDKILKNERRGTDRRADPEFDEVGQFDEFAAGTDDAEQMLVELRDWLQERAKKFPFSDEAKVQMGWDPKTNFPIEYIEHEVDAKDTIVIDVPDRHLEEPLSDPEVADRFLLMYGPKGVDLAKELAAGKHLVLRGAETGKMYLAAGADVSNAPPKGDFPEVYRKAESQYHDSGYVLPRNNGSMLAVAVEQLAPLANTRDIDAKMQSVKVGKAEDFEAMVSPTLGYTSKPQTGLIMRKYEFVPAVGPARFQETDGDGVENGWEVEGEIKSVREITLRQLREAVKSRKFTDQHAQKYGYAGTADMMSRVSKMFDDELIRERRTTGPGATSDETIILIDLKKPVSRDTMAYNSHTVISDASITRDFLGDSRTDFDLKKQLKPSSLKSLSEPANTQPSPTPGGKRNPKVG
ncbi:MAG: hypothetical protein CL558_12850 [Alphaproteobacteria bacterium]|nr:hypothetical protein [Alphaproteobacteria bacterium]MAS46404.1 hypothetical protein [Alphaproteobacteria bacterium]MAX94499.1 hypothetical protein [Alphaproteobacteria bacterium]MBN54451.1 hypothetical protein [Alphaproteobacteria bacterium]OUT41997.1 MAG: hypothetical protein CBB62_06735 [Micavibrio sp. TMED2]|tara:strand:- start:225 stop:3629 length:3405 start_codon:yes stop_codon:yes gene_type:complete